MDSHSWGPTLENSISTSYTQSVPLTEDASVCEVMVPSRAQLAAEANGRVRTSVQRDS